MGIARPAKPQILRDALVRALEWRARHFSDPADRLQFLRRKMAERLPGSGQLSAGEQTWGAEPTSVREQMPGEARDGNNYPRFQKTCIRHIERASVIAVTLFLAFENTETTTILPQRPKANSQIRLVQATPQFDLYSNGLRIEDQYATSTAQRRYLVFATNRHGPIAAAAEWRTEPAGIVYHTTESHWAPFEESENRSLRRAGEGLLDYVSRRHSYHFVIDRFGRVFRIVRESDYANHAGNSIWADRFWIYINLNQSFLGVAFEARSKPDGPEPAVNAAQVYAGRILTDMLRAHYRIAASNCVAHAQVSVNPSNHGVGYHLDWAANLPFAQLGLPDNYKLSLPSVALFGFVADPALIELSAGSAEGGISQGFEAALAEVRGAAAARDLPVERYRKQLQQRYRDAIQALRGNGAYQEYN